MTDPAPLSLVVIGHVNHGKTALVRALTGIETDRLKEEVARGLSITLGYAWREYPSGEVDFIDAPGHEDFIRAMTMGATGARAALLVVSATEGFGRQTREHLRIAGLLGIRAGVVAVTKADLTPGAGAVAACERIAAELEGTFLAGEPMVLCSAVTGAGLSELHDHLQALAARSPRPDRLPGAWLPLDRVFSIAGAGTVATGTLQGGALAAGAAAVLEPSGRPVSLRSVQVHGQAVEAAPPGGRVAVGLRGVSADEVRAGEVLCAPGAYAAAQMVDVEVTLAPESARALKANDEVRVMWGARQDIAKVRPIGTSAIAPGARGLVRLRFAATVVAHAGQRAVLRRPSPAETIGGVTVLDPAPPPLRGRLETRRPLLDAVAARDLEAIAVQLALRGGGVLSLAETARLSLRTADEARDHLAATFEGLDDDLMATRAAIAQARDAYLARVTHAHREAPARSWVSVGAIRGGLTRISSRDLVAHVERRLAASGEDRLEGAQVALPGHDPFAALSPTALARLSRIEQAFREGGVTPPDLAAVVAPGTEDGDLLGLLVESGRLVSLRNVALRQTLAFHAEALANAVTALAAAFPAPATFATGEARAALGTSRKFIVPLLEFLDERGDTVREGDVRRMVENRFGVPRNPL
ncbi:SelB C-terminal domain-containing protein [uncultured Phenylobacterium sp.]|uniref:selenocysteine-specific translation elongation factor n=1 Tax=uncultured Phenylobacterium sp. TaxID=349273 RepID=UPI0025E89D32|nr:selenocysteine-specific translation elongation factor [uncultured Phenylobacterium sp.]